MEAQRRDRLHALSLLLLPPASCLNLTLLPQFKVITKLQGLAFPMPQSDVDLALPVLGAAAGGLTLIYRTQQPSSPNGVPQLPPDAPATGGDASESKDGALNAADRLQWCRPNAAASPTGRAVAARLQLLMVPACPNPSNSPTLPPLLAHPLMCCRRPVWPPPAPPAPVHPARQRRLAAP